MAIVTISKTLAREKDLIAVPRSTYGEFLAWQKRIKARRTFRPSVAERRALVRDRKNFSRGRYVTLDELEHELGGRR